MSVHLAAPDVRHAACRRSAGRRARSAANQCTATLSSVAPSWWWYVRGCGRRRVPEPRGCSAL